MPISKFSILYFFLLINIVAIAQTTQKTVIAVKGDGIYSILRKNNLEPTTHLEAFIKLNKKNLKPDNALVIGKSYILPKALDNTKPSKKDTNTANKINYPLFGKNHNTVILENKKLDGAIYYLISGHGGPDPGAIETYKNKIIAEDEYAYDVTLRLAKILMSNGAKVYIIIKDKNDGIRDQEILEADYDETCYPENPISRSQKLRLRQRTKAVNDLYLKHKGAYQRLIVTHVDSRSKSKNIDVFFYHHASSKNGKRLAENIHKSFKQKYAEHQPNRIYSGTISSRGLYLVKKTFPAMVFIELGNIKNLKDQKRILNYNNREALAKWIHNGLLTDFNEHKK